MTQLPLYSEMGLGTRDYVEALKIHWDVTVKDALMVVAVFLAIGFLLRNWQWVKSFNRGWVMLWITLPLWQAVVEYYSVYLYHRWAYAEAMPLILGIGLSPILQMLILPSLAILLSRYYIPNSHE